MDRRDLSEDLRQVEESFIYLAREDNDPWGWEAVCQVPGSGPEPQG